MNNELLKVLEELVAINEKNGYVSYEDVANKVKEYSLTPKDVKLIYKELNEKNIALKDVIEEKPKQTTKTKSESNVKKKEAKVSKNSRSFSLIK